MRRSVPRVAITVIAVAASVMSSLYVIGADGYVPGDPVTHPTWLSGLGLIGALSAAVMLCWRHRYPVLVTALATGPPLLFVTDTLAALIALAALAASRGDRVLWGGAVLVYLATALAVWRDAGRHPHVTVAGRLFDADSTATRIVGTLVLAAVCTAVPLVVGIVRRAKRDLAQRELLEHELRAEMTRRDERSRIAHEMHDVLGHRLSLLSLQAGALEVTHSSPQAGEVARTVRSTARQSLEDLRQVIGVLRDGRELLSTDDAGPVQRPQPSLADLPELVANAREAGLSVNLTVLLDQAATAPAPLGIAVYRIIQESLTNVVRHAPGAAAEVTVRGGPGFGIAVDVVNPLVAAEPAPGSGTGIAGMVERAGVLGGNVAAGPTVQRTFAVRAWLPWAAS